MGRGAMAEGGVAGGDVEPVQATGKTIACALAVLGLFNYAAPEWTIPDIARALRIPYSTAYRYVTTLEAGDFLVRHRPGAAYRLGLPVIELAGVALNQLDVRVQGLSHLDHLADATGLNANMAVLHGGDVFHIAYAVRSAVPRMYSALGRRAVAHCTALGKGMLADLPFAEVRRRVERYGWRPYTPASLRGFAELERALTEVRERGYALDQGERRRGGCCVAAPIHGRSGRVIAAISVSGSEATLRGERLHAVIAAVTEHAGLIAYRMGYDAAHVEAAPEQ